MRVTTISSTAVAIMAKAPWPGQAEHTRRFLMEQIW